jgi:hypothetical protein
MTDVMLDQLNMGHALDAESKENLYQFMGGLKRRKSKRRKTKRRRSKTVKKQRKYKRA